MSALSLSYLVSNNIKEIKFTKYTIPIIIPLDPDDKTLFNEITSSFDKYLQFHQSLKPKNDEFKEIYEYFINDFRSKNMQELVIEFENLKVTKEQEISFEDQIMNTVIEYNEYIAESGNLHQLPYEIAKLYFDTNDVDYFEKFVNEGITVSKTQCKKEGFIEGIQLIQNCKINKNSF